jgi:hypothetical protein
LNIRAAAHPRRASLTNTLEVHWKRIFAALAAWILVAAGGGVHAEILDRILAVVNGTVITLSDVTASRDLGLVPSEGATDPVRVVLSR